MTATARQEVPRYFVRFPSAKLRKDAVPMLGLEAVPGEQHKPMFSEEARRILITPLSEHARNLAESEGCEIFPDIQFAPFDDPAALVPPPVRYWDPSSQPAIAAAPWASKSLRDVVEHIRAPAAWARSRGDGVTIGIVDTGVAGHMPEFPAAKRSPLSKGFRLADPWTDAVGHGSMCAAAAAGTTSSGGRYDGVAPDAQIMSLRTTLEATDLYLLYEWVINERRAGHFPGPVVLSNSYGLYICSASGVPEQHPYLEAIRTAVADGIPVFFAAGNNHRDVCGGDPASCEPNTIWSVNSIDDVLSVGTVNWDERMDAGEHANSSRGPGEWAATTSKPDCVAPTYGEIVWGGGYQKMEWWGTSGACPQVAGLAALLLNLDNGLTPARVYDTIRQTSRSIGLPRTCAGHGIIDCDAAVRQIL